MTPITLEFLRYFCRKYDKLFFSVIDRYEDMESMNFEMMNVSGGFVEEVGSKKSTPRRENIGTEV